MKKFLIISVGPVPTDKKSIVEGGGLRAWGIAKGLISHGINITIAVPDNFPTKATTTKEGIKVCNWSFANLKELCEKHDAVYVLYSRGDLMKFIATKTDLQKPVVIDLYVPIYTESLARTTRKDFTGLKEHLMNVEHWNYAFARGDYFLCANAQQEHFYNGALGVFGRINPLTYEGNLLNMLPFGVHKESPTHNKNVFKGKVIDKEDFLILWFGGIYPWFDINPLLKAVENLSKKHPNIKLLILGGRNPFVTESEFIEKYESVVATTKKMGLFDKNVFFIDWIPYDERSNWYLEADVLVNLHDADSAESVYAWRTRVVDYIWGELPIVSSGGDSLSEMLESKNAVKILKNNGSEEIFKSIDELYKNPSKILELKKNIVKVKKSLYWDTLTRDLAKFIKKGDISPDRKMLIRNNFVDKDTLSIKSNESEKERNKFMRRVSYSFYLLKNEGISSFIRKFKILIRKSFK